MPAEKTEAIILRVVEFSETSCIVTLLTRDFGKITAIAKGARRPKSPFEAAIDVLSICRIVFIQKTNAMSILTEAKLEHRFRAAERSLSRLYVGFYVVELLRILTDEGDTQPELFQLAVDMIRDLDSNTIVESDLRLRLLHFELGLLDLLGHLPMLTKCVNCGREKTMLSKVWFGLNAGGVLCQNCRRGNENVVTISEKGFEQLLSLVGAQIGLDEANSDNWNQVDRVNEHRLRYQSWTPKSIQLNLLERDKKQNKDEPIPVSTRNADDDSSRESLETVLRDQSEQETQTEVWRLIHQYLSHLIGYSPRLYKYLQNIKAGNPTPAVDKDVA